MPIASVLKLNETVRDILTPLIRLCRILSPEQKALLAAGIVGTEAELCAILGTLIDGVEPR